MVFPCGIHSITVHPSHLKSQFPWSLWAEGIVLASFSCMMFVMPFHALSFSFQLKVDAANKVVAFDSILFHQP
jgi:hypothetical protein